METQDIASTSTGNEGTFDFAAHRRDAVDRYAEVRELYEECAQAVRSVLKTALEVEEIGVQSIEARGKSVESFGDKSVRSADDANRPKYPDPVDDITDLAGVRVIVFLPDRIDEVGALVEREFDVRERTEVSPGTGYRGVHYLVTFSAKRNGLPEYRRFANRVTEIQVRTVLQHAWSEVEHGIAYKPKAPISDAIRRQLQELAGALSVADRGLQSVASETAANT
jgi:ppGpp synthetase/RelA/SpoT-type nucleotidyltranferase